MTRRNKGTAKAARRSYSMSKRAEFDADRDKAVEVLALFPDAPLMDAHRVLFMCLRSIEEAMEVDGVKPPNYVEHRVTRVQHDLGPDFTYCRQCESSQVDGEDAMGKWSKCLHPQSFGRLCSYSDGCTFGVKRRDYR